MILATHRMSEKALRRSSRLVSLFLNRQIERTLSVSHCLQVRQKGSPQLFKPVPIKPEPAQNNIGEELCGTLSKADLMRVVNKFIELPQLSVLAKEYGLDDSLRPTAIKNFQMYCLKTPQLPTDLHVTISDILSGGGNVSDIFPFFLRYTKQIFPHLGCLSELKRIGDLRKPANWYPIARAKTRKIIFHAGPTNSGKTYRALNKFMTAKSGVYCGPLKLLVAEVFQKSNSMGTPCDLVTGEERSFANSSSEPSTHVSCSVEMVNLNQDYEVAVIDEIQMLRDPDRGWAWTRALLGVAADEIHLCGERAALDLVKSLCETTGEEVDVHEYKRLTPLEIEKKALEDLSNVRPGDCIVCFNKNDIFQVSHTLESKGVQIAVIYGSLPPGAKLAQAARFNDKNDPCKVLVATTAIGMGLNLHIRRVIFYSLLTSMVNEKGLLEKSTISVSSALQIAGRAGRFGTQWEKGFVTTYKAKDLPVLKDLLHQSPEKITKAGLHPTPDQIELYAYHLPHASLSNLMDIFVSLCTVDDSQFFMCNVDDFKFLADTIEHVSLSLRTRYVFCCAPINRKLPFMVSMFLKFARQYSRNDKISLSWLHHEIGWPYTLPKNLGELIHMEAVFDVLDLYLWLSTRFSDMFPDYEKVRQLQKELDSLIQNGIVRLTALLTNTIAKDLEKKKRSVEKSDESIGRTENALPVKGKSRSVAKGNLEEQLVKEGLLTKEVIDKLHLEWQSKQKGD